MAQDKLTAVGLDLSICFNLLLISNIKFCLSFNSFNARKDAKAPATPIAGAPLAINF